MMLVSAILTDSCRVSCAEVLGPVNYPPGISGIAALNPALASLVATNPSLAAMMATAIDEATVPLQVGSTWFAAAVMPIMHIWFERL